MLERVPESQESPSFPYISCTTRESIDALQPTSHTDPIVIFGDEALGNHTAAESVTQLRARKIQNPIIFYVRTRIVSSIEKAEFLDSGGSVVIDRSDIGSPEEDPQGDAILKRQIRLVTVDAEKRSQEKQHTETSIRNIFYDGRLQKFYIKDKALPLTPGETKVLQAFIKLLATSKTGRVVKTELTSELYGSAEKGQIRALQVHVAHLNGRLGPHGIQIKVLSYGTGAYEVAYTQE